MLRNRVVWELKYLADPVIRWRIFIVEFRRKG